MYIAPADTKNSTFVWQSERYMKIFNFRRVKEKLSRGKIYVVLRCADKKLKIINKCYDYVMCYD